ncbi:MAG: hypothetical protein U0166_11655 [Acidobacteriota bacterium]
MKIRTTLLPALMLASYAPAVCPSEPFACNMNALTPDERARHAALTRKLLEAAIGQEDLPDGFVFELDAKVAPLPEVAEWISFESRCCPFLDFSLELHRKDAHPRLKLSGDAGVKEFLAAELGVSR